MDLDLASNESSDSKDMLLAIGGVALVVFGAGLILTHPFVRRYIGQAGLGGLIAAAVPDLERYLKLKSM
jgi:hypothetical protein